MRKSKKKQKSRRASPNKKSKGSKSDKKSKCFPKVYNPKTKRCRKSKRKTSMTSETYNSSEAKAAQRRLVEQEVASLMLELTKKRGELNNLAMQTT